MPFKAPPLDVKKLINVLPAIALISVPTSIRFPVILALPLKFCPQIVLVVCKVVAVEALPVKLALIVAGNFKVGFPLPLTLTAGPVLVALLSAI